MSLKDSILESPLIYRLWQAPFADRKLSPVLAHNDMNSVRRVLDVGCGPGTNARYFEHADYTGIDFNPEYIADARRKFKGTFIVADVTEYHAKPGEQFDFILVNSILHHIDDANTQRILAHLSTLLTRDGHVHILELVNPQNASMAQLLARWDRGNFARPLARWKEMFTNAFEPVVVEAYPLSAFGVQLWNMIYFKGRAHS